METAIDLERDVDAHIALQLEAIGNLTRLRIFQLLITAGRGGLPVADIQKALSVPGSTLSHHLTKLVSVGLVRQERRSRQLICTANYKAMDEVVDYLTSNCCAMERHVHD